jgi:hypothetical protein
MMMMVDAEHERSNAPSHAPGNEKDMYFYLPGILLPFLRQQQLYYTTLHARVALLSFCFSLPSGPLFAQFVHWCFCLVA